jgi:Arginine-tRNA-protein transferase, C terminus
LVTSPLVPEPVDAVDNTPCAALGMSIPPFPGRGSFHLQYRVDGRLIAVSVLDLLPGMVSSVYLFYDPDFGFLSPGVTTVLFEIECVRAWATQIGDANLSHYCLGYYVHSCSKMRYKAQYGPCELLDPVSLDRWVPFNDDLRRGLDARPYFAFDTLEDALPETEHSPRSAGIDPDSPSALARFIDQDVVFAYDADEGDGDALADADADENMLRQPMLIGIDSLTESGQRSWTKRIKEWVRRVGVDLAREMVVLI